MIEFQWSKRDKTQTPVMFNTDIWEYAELLVGDYKPRLLKEPGELNGLHFIESYLGANLDFMDLYCEKNEILAGATTFNKERVKVFDREHLCTRYYEIPADTIIIDNDSMTKYGDGFAKFTQMHEAGHFFLHPAVYRKCAEQLSLFDEPAPSIVCCRISVMEQSLKPKAKSFTPEERREQQANVFAAFTMMPRQTFIPIATELIKKAGFRDGIFVDQYGAYYELKGICEAIASVYGVSKTAAKLHLKELKLLMDEEQYVAHKAQVSMGL